MQPKYYYYISQNKIAMLEPQLGGKFPKAELSPKIDLPGVSLSVQIKGKTSEDSTVKRLLDLLTRMKRQKLITDLPAVNTLEASHFYADQSSWYHGLYAFSAPLGLGADSVRVISYLLWKPWNDALIFLAGSPQFVLGDKTVHESVQVYQTTGTWSSIFNFASSILRTDERNFVGAADEVPPAGEKLAAEIPWVKWKAESRDREQEVLPVEMSASPEALSIGIMCVRYLTHLPRENMDLVFQVFRSLPFVRRTDLPRWANELINFSSTDPQLKQMLWRCKTIYVGSPLYTAFG
jgi:hypothetical protein